MYLRQICVNRTFRRKGIGRLAVQALTGEIWVPGKRTRVNVPVGTYTGLAFWPAAEFIGYTLTRETKRRR